MRKLNWLISGVVLGFIAAHFVNQTTEGRRFFDRIGQGAREFSDAVASGYRDGDAAAPQDEVELERELARLRNKISE